MRETVESSEVEPNAEPKYVPELQKKIKYLQQLALKVLKAGDLDRLRSLRRELLETELLLLERHYHSTKTELDKLRIKGLN